MNSSSAMVRRRVSRGVFVRVSNILVCEHPVILKRKPYEHIRHRKLHRLPSKVAIRYAPDLARHSGQIDTHTARHECIVKLTELACPKPDEVIEYSVTYELHGITCQEHGYLMPLVQGALRNEEA